MLIGSICAAIAICLLGGFLCFRYVRQTFDEVDHMLDQAIQGHFDFATIAGETRQGKLCHTQIGMTATPKETKYISNLSYFGEPVYSYSLKEGIEDGFLAPFKVINVTTNIGEGWRPSKGQKDINGVEIPDRIYTNSDYDYNIIIEDRIQQVAEEITRYLKSTDRMLEAVNEVLPDAKYQRCTVHFYRNVFSVVPRSKVKLVAKMLKAIHAQENKKAAREKAKAVVAQLKEMKLKEAARKVEDNIEETLTYCDFPYEHWARIRTNNVIERLNREIRRRTRVVGTFPDGNSALMLVCARLRHVAGTQWGNKKYMNMKHLEAALEDVSIAG